RMNPTLRCASDESDVAHRMNPTLYQTPISIGGGHALNLLEQVFGCIRRRFQSVAPGTCLSRFSGSDADFNRGAAGVSAVSDADFNRWRPRLEPA
ncbi:hypothetical protein, partial [Candidatus Amarolinea dominans]|uniref:hypothetical protein n=1 Tax=Candidatus Amarolinea dominans TaxID=3140696 RepID=UPI0031CCAF04